jgi:two-component system, chemotaxis family, CheB/CheR fusion protein
MHNPNQDLYIIAIGASAGGMEAIHLLFDHTPEDGVSYVIIQHLSPDHKSFMAELLAKHSKLKICVVENNVHIEPNHVYLMPRGVDMIIKNRTLFINERQTTQPNTSIDMFLNSLAETEGKKAIAVILSGTGTDGTKGVAAIKKAGGYVIVQDPDTAKFNGMPTSVIESGYADAILAPEVIPDEIMSYLNRNQLEYDLKDNISNTDEAAFSDILNLIREHTPLDFKDYKRPTIIRRLARRISLNKINSLSLYKEYLRDNPSEITALAKEFLISVTNFFRDEAAFKLIKEKAIPDIVKNKILVDTLKVWVVGCATGEEAYSLAIMINEHLTDIKKNLEVKIFASDIDKDALKHASKAVYSENVVKDVSEERIKKFFIKEDNKYRVRENIRKMIIFAEHDIIKQPPYGKLDLICCRNVLIYFNPLLQKKIIATLHFSLNLGGYLLLGPSESLGDSKQYFQEIDKKWKLYKNKELGRNIRDTNYVAPGLKFNPIPQVHPVKNINRNNIAESIDNALLMESGYEAGVCVDRDFVILQSFGQYEKFLLPKMFNFNLLEMLPEELSIATSTALHKTIRQDKKIAVSKVNFKHNGTILSCQCDGKTDIGR